MKTVGQLLRSARKAQAVTIKNLARQTKIDPCFIKALEKDNYQKLPSPTFIKGFIRNLSLSLNKNPDELIAVFRRDYALSSSLKNPSPFKRQKFKASRFSKQWLLIISGVLIFFTYLAFQYRSVLILPKLELVQPQPNQVLASPITIEGFSSTDSIITFNQSLQKIKPDQSGYFITTIELPLGNTELLIKAVNRFNRIRIKKIPLTIVSQD